MNERIRELVERSGLYIALDNQEATDKEIEFFAELIIQECIACIRGAVLTDEVAERNNLGFNDGLSAAVVNTQKHFGVEE
jgi:hypothetical protein